MTEQVINATDEVEKELSEEELYEAEWAEDDDSKDSTKSAEVEEKADDEDTASDDSVSKTENGTNTEDTGTDSAESASQDDIWATASPELKKAFDKTLNDFNSIKGRHGASERQKADLEKELKTLRAAEAERNRKKGAYELNHPELFEELSSALASKNVVETEDTSEQEDADIATVQRVHSDLFTVLNTEEWATFKGSLTESQAAQYNSPDPFEFAALVTEFKISRANAQAASASNKLEESARAGGTSSKAAPAKKMSTTEAYDAEWEKA